jgi:hypothetical protein
MCKSRKSSVSLCRILHKYPKLKLFPILKLFHDSECDVNKQIKLTNVEYKMNNGKGIFNIL